MLKLIKIPKIYSGRGRKVLPSTATVDMLQQRKYVSTFFKVVSTIKYTFFHEYVPH